MDILMRRHLRKEEVPLITYTDLLVIATVSTSEKVPMRCIVYNKLWDTTSDSMQLNYEISANQNQAYRITKIICSSITIQVTLAKQRGCKEKISCAPNNVKWNFIQDAPSRNSYLTSCPTPTIHKETTGKKKEIMLNPNRGRFGEEFLKEISSSFGDSLIKIKT